MMNGDAQGGAASCVSEGWLERGVSARARVYVFVFVYVCDLEGVCMCVRVSLCVHVCMKL